MGVETACWRWLTLMGNCSVMSRFRRGSRRNPHQSGKAEAACREPRSHMAEPQCRGASRHSSASARHTGPYNFSCHWHFGPPVRTITHTSESTGIVALFSFGYPWISPPILYHPLTIRQSTNPAIHTSSYPPIRPPAHHADIRRCYSHCCNHNSLSDHDDGRNQY